MSGLEQTRFQTGFNMVAGPLYCVGKLISHFTCMWPQLRWYAFNIKQCKKIKLPKEWPYSIQKLFIYNESSRLLSTYIYLVLIVSILKCNWITPTWQWKGPQLSYFLTKPSCQRVWPAWSTGRVFSLFILYCIWLSGCISMMFLTSP